MTRWLDRFRRAKPPTGDPDSLLVGLDTPLTTDPTRERSRDDVIAFAEQAHDRIEALRPRYEEIARRVRQTQGEEAAEIVLEAVDEFGDILEGLKLDADLGEESADRMQWRTSSALVMMAGMVVSEIDGYDFSEVAKAELDRRNTEALIQHSELMFLHNEQIRKSTEASHWLAFAVLFVALVQVVLFVWQIMS